MNFQIDPIIADMYPDVKLGILIVSDIDNHTPHPEISSLLREVEKEVRATYELEQLATTPKISDWREAYRKFGCKPSFYRSSIEALLRRVLQGKELPSISPLVDLYTQNTSKVSIWAIPKLSQFDDRKLPHIVNIG